MAQGEGKNQLRRAIALRLLVQLATVLAQDGGKPWRGSHGGPGVVADCPLSWGMLPIKDELNPAALHTGLDMQEAVLVYRGMATTQQQMREHKADATLLAMQHEWRGGAAELHAVPTDAQVFADEQQHRFQGPVQGKGGLLATGRGDEILQLSQQQTHLVALLECQAQQIAFCIVLGRFAGHAFQHTAHSAEGIAQVMGQRGRQHAGGLEYCRLFPQGGQRFWP